MKDTQAKKILILKLMRGFPSSQERITEGVVESYLGAIENIGLEALDRSVTQFLTGKVDGRNNGFLPSAPELAANARQWQEAIAQVDANRALKAAQRMIVYPVGEQPPAPLKPLGSITMEIEGIMRDTSEWTFEEKEYALNTGKMPPSRDLLRNPAITADKTRPRIQRMSDK